MEAGQLLCFAFQSYFVNFQEWVTSLGQQVRAARQSCVLPSKLPSLQPLPPPHVRPTLTPPYIHLTEWIRALLAQNQLSLEQIRSLRKPCRIVSQSVQTNPRKHKVEMVIYPQLKLQQPSLEALDRRIMQEFRKKKQHHDEPEMLVTLKDPSRPESTESNPFGFIRYMDKPDEPFASSLSKSKYVEDKQEDIVSYNNEEMAFLLPKSLLESCTSVLSRQDTVGSQEEAPSPTPDAPWGRRLPPLHGTDPAPPPLRVTSELATTSEPRCRAARPVAHASSAPALSEKPADRPRRHRSPNRMREESPPDWLSCFPKSPKPRRKAFSATKAEAAARIPEDAYKKAPTRPPTMKYIDKTPSADSLNLPYCPPVKVDYEDFSNSSLFHMQQTTNPGFMSPQLPRRNKTARLHSKIRSRSLGRTSQLAVIPVDDPSELPRLHCTELVAEVASYPRRQEEARAPHCTCDSRRSSDSGLADIASHSEQCPLWRSLQSVTSLPGTRAPPAPSTRQCSCGASLPPAQHSLSLEQLPMTPALTPDPALSCGNLSSEIQAPARWNRTKETYKTGLYAHWWLNASLQPISEEPHLSTQL